MHREAEDTTEAGCETPGRILIFCPDCGESLREEEIPATGHRFGEWDTVTEPGCTTEGMKKHTCTVEGCGHEEEESIEALEHDYAEEFTIDTEATCLSEGSKSKHCSRCDSTTEVTELPATGHSYGDWQTVTEPGCTTEGMKKHTCTADNCGHEEEEAIEALEHDYATEFSTDAEATCTAPGSKSKHCSRCDSTAEVTEIPAAGHSYGDWQTITEPTCTTEGMKKHICTVDGCGHEEEETIDALGHDYATAFTVDTAATCQSVGSKSKHCSRCDSTTEVTEIPITGHSYGEWETLVAATCTTSGERKRTCTTDGCGAEQEGTINATGHAYGDMRTELPTDTSNGRTFYRCGICGEETDEHVILGINGVNFPDEGFRTLLESYNTDWTEGLSEEEVAVITYLEIASGSTCVSLEGIDLLTSLTALIVNSASVTDLALNGCTSLTQLSLMNATGITELDLSGNAALNNISLEGLSNLTTIDLSNRAALTMLSVNDCTSLTALDVSSCAALNNLGIYGCTELTSLDFSNCTSLINTPEFGTCTKLRTIDAGGSGISSFIVNNLAMLERIDISDTEVSILETNGCTALTGINASGTCMREVNISTNTALETLDLSGNTTLTWLDASENEALVSVNLNGCTSLSGFTMNGDTKTYAMESINITGCTALSDFTLMEAANVRSLSFSGLGEISSIVLSGCTGLDTLTLTETSLDALNLSYCTALTSVDMTGVTAIYGNMVTIVVTGTTLTDSSFVLDSSLYLNLTTE